MSLRSRLLLGMAVVAVMLVVVATGVTRITQANLVRQVDEQLTRAVPKLRGPGGPLADGDDPGGATGGQTSSLYVAVVVDDQIRTVIEPGLTMADPVIPALTAEMVVARRDGAAFTVGSLKSDVRFRVQVRTVGRQGRAVAFALPLKDVDDTVQRLIALEALGSLAILGVLALVSLWVLRLGVRPLKQMTASAMAIAEGDLKHRVPDARPGTEAGELGLALNHMLTRIEDAFAARSASEGRLRQFVADASHELRTPLTTIRGYTELYRVGGLTDPTELDAALHRTEQEAIRMGSLVEDLLHLARMDQGRPMDLTTVNLTALLNDAAQDMRAVEPDRPVSVTASGVVSVVGDEPRLRQIIANLSANARTHTPRRTAVHLRVRGTEHGAEIEVADDGPGMTADVASRAFERFYRADPARTRETGGSGLGLSIVAAAVAAHGGAVAIDTAPGRGTTVRLVLPAVPPTAPT
ncbi:MAG: HAMP domain-containing sensor histidine kinase [Aquihabitans sp.]